MSFEDFEISPNILSGLHDIKFETPTPLQAEVIPPALAGKNILVNTSDKEGIDIAFLTPALHRASISEKPGTLILILTPTIERVTQLDELIWAVGYRAKIESASISMKGNTAEQESLLKNQPKIVVANPGRFAELMDKTQLKLEQLELLIIDQAHEMYNFNMVRSVENILAKLGSEPQVIVASDSYNDATRKLALAALKNPELIGFEQEAPNGKTAAPENDPVVEVQPGESATVPAGSEPQAVEAAQETESPEAEPIKLILKKDKPAPAPEPPSSPDAPVKSISEHLEHAFIHIPPRMKISTLVAYIQEQKIERALIFASSKRTVDRLYRVFKKRNWAAASIFSGIDDALLNERLTAFREGQKNYFFVGDLSAESLNVGHAPCVINYDVPDNVREYRLRASLVENATGTPLISLVSKMDKEDMEIITKEVGNSPSEIPLPVDVLEKKKKTSSKKPTARNPRSISVKLRDKSKKSGIKNPKELSLPRANFDKLNGGRSGEKNPGLFGWVKKLFS